MTLRITIHQTQIDILKELLFVPEAGFAQMQKIAGLSSDHFKFHIAKLVEVGYVEKHDTKYRLTTAGKEYANKLDTDARIVERQPKVAVMLVVERERNDEKEYFLQERLKHPYFGFWGPPTGKVRWGESIVETATRELKEETGLDGVFVHRGINHERVKHDRTGEIIEDKVFHLMFCNNTSGILLDVFDGCRNQWRTMKDIATEPKKYKSFDGEMEVGLRGIPFTEIMHVYGDDEF